MNSSKILAKITGLMKVYRGNASLHLLFAIRFPFTPFFLYFLRFFSCVFVVPHVTFPRIGNPQTVRMFRMGFENKNAEPQMLQYFYVCMIWNKLDIEFEFLFLVSILARRPWNGYTCASFCGGTLSLGIECAFRFCIWWWVGVAVRK